MAERQGGIRMEGKKDGVREGGEESSVCRLDELGELWGWSLAGYKRKERGPDEKERRTDLVIH